MRLLVTVGTTRFDKLVERVLQVLRSPRIQDEFSEVMVQIGKSDVVIPAGAEMLATEPDSWSGLSNKVTRLDEAGPCLSLIAPPARKLIPIRCFRYTRYLKDLMEDADIILCHCGAGTLLEALGTPAVIWAVNNDSLAGDHQRELGEDLGKLGKIFYIPSEALRSTRAFGDKIFEALESGMEVRGKRDAARLSVAKRQLVNIWHEVL